MTKGNRGPRSDEQRCAFIKPDGTRCGNYVADLSGLDELLSPDDARRARCRFHGASLNGKEVLAKDVAPVLKFWDENAETVDDVGEALLRLAGRLTSTLDYLGAEIEDQLERHKIQHDAWVSRTTDGVELCPVCGWDETLDEEPESPLSKGAADMWKFVTKELSTLLTKIQALGLAERQIAFQEQTAGLMAQVLSSAMMKAGIEGAQAEVVRGEVISQLSHLEAERPPERAPEPQNGTSERR